MTFLIKNVFSQGETYKIDGNNNGTTVSKLGWKNNADLKIVTNDSARIIVKSDGDVEIMKNLKIYGKLTGENIQFDALISDSMKISQYLTADSIHARCIKIGDSSIYIGSTGMQTGFSNRIQSDNGVLGFGNLGTNFWDFTLGLGKENTAFIPDISLDAAKDININPEHAYRINTVKVLQVGPFSGRNILLGEEAGASIPFIYPLSGFDNAFLGFKSGYNNSTGNENTFVGSQAGYSNTIEGKNTYIGMQAGYLSTTGSLNTATGYQALYNNTGLYNTCNGALALYSNTTGFYNNAIGYKSLYSNLTGSCNTANGTEALCFNTYGDSCTATGYNALLKNTVGFSNTANGCKALYQNTTGRGNTASGRESLMSNTTGHQNTANGEKSLMFNTTGWNNTATGTGSLASNLTGNWNTATGIESLYLNSMGSENTANGSKALMFSLGSGNTGIGFKALYNNSSGNNNTALGYSADVSSGNLHNATAIGANALVDASNSLVLGSFGFINGIDYNINVGIGTSSPDNRLEIASTFLPLVPGRSGLRLTNLNNNFVPTTNTTTALTVNSDGDVILSNILVPSVAFPFGGICSLSSPPPHLSNNWEIPMEQYNFIFSGQYSGKTNVGIGIVGCDPVAKLDVFQNFDFIGVNSLINSGNFGTRAIKGRSDNSNNQVGVEGIVSNGGRQIGIRGEAINPMTGNIGVEGVAKNTGTQGTINFGGSFEATGSFNNNRVDEVCSVKGVAGGDAKTSYGGWFSAFNGNTTYGVKASAEPNPGKPGQIGPGGIIIPPIITYGYGGHFTTTRTSLLNQSIYGVFSQINSLYNFPIGQNWAGYFAGRVFSTGGFVTSDSILKQNITNITQGLSVITQLKPEKFNYDTVNYSYLGLPVGLQYGLTAQEVENIVPELVTDVIHPAQFDTAGNEISPQLKFKGLNYTGLIPILVQGVKELDSTISPLISREVPVLISPLNGANNVTPEWTNFTWSGVHSAIGYFIETSLDSLFDYTKEERNIQYVMNDTTFTMYKNMFSSNTTYYWRVYAIKASGSYASDVYSFTTLPLTAPVLVTPANADTNISISTSVNFIWNRSVGANYYGIDLSVDSTFNTSTNFKFSTLLNDTSIALSLPTDNTVYYWRVNCFNIYGQSQTSEVWHFKTRKPFIPAPILISPVSNATEVPLPEYEFKWHSAQGAGTYSLLLSTTPNQANAFYSTSTNDTVLKFYPPPGVQIVCGATYYWWVKASNASGLSAISEGRSFSVLTTPPVPPVLALPEQNDTLVRQPAFEWHPSVKAYNYMFYLSTTPDTSGLILSQNTKKDTSYQCTLTLLENKTYYWWVTARNFCGNSSISEIRPFVYMNFSFVQAQSIFELSDVSLKTNVAPLSGSLSKVEQLEGVYFDWDTLLYPQIKFDNSRQIGLIAQEVRTIIPEVVRTDGLGFNYVEYNRLIPVLIEAVKELNGKIDSLQTKVNSCCTTTKSGEITTNQGEESESLLKPAKDKQTHTIDIELASQAAILYQNMPNPFGDGTSIRFFIPENIKNANILFYNEYGQELKNVKISEKGMGQINLGTPNLASGIYTYSLLIDGKLIDTKRMMRMR